MKRRTVLTCIIFFVMTVWFTGHVCATDKTNVFVSILPQKYFVEMIAGDLVHVSVMVKPDKSPADYEPSPSQMRMLTKTAVYFAIGVPFEDTWLQRFARMNPDMRIIHTENGIKKKPVNRHAHIQILSSPHDSKTHAHSHEGIQDPHIWLSPPLVKTQSETIYKELIAIAPEHTAICQKNYQRFVSQLDALDRELKQLFSSGMTRKEFLVFHPSWGYFADAYGLHQVSIEIEGKAPKAHDLKKLMQYAAQHDIRTIFVQPQFSTKHAKIIANEINGKIVYADPMAEDWQENLQAVAISIKNAMR